MAARRLVTGALVLPVDDVEYEIKPLIWQLGEQLSQVAAGKHKTIKHNSPDEVLFKMCMGDAWDEMEKNNVPYSLMFRAGAASIIFQTALVQHADLAVAMTLAEQTWDDGGMDPELLAAALTAATPQEPETSETSTSSASGGKTPPRASTKPTTSRRRTPPAKSSPKRATTRSGSKPSGKPSGRTSS
jgi:hypothetical protein